MGFQSRIKPKKSLGQNFFRNKSLAKHIVNLVLENSPEHITEIGPGKGAFTSLFYGATKNMTLVETDVILSSELANVYKNATILHQDFLEIPLTFSPTTYFGSLPYNISKPIIKKIITSDTFTNPAFFIIQKEVAEKYANKKTNLLGLMREIYADCKILLTIKPSNFYPKPNVMSSFIKFIPHDRHSSVDKGALEKLIRNSFIQPRKTLKNNLRNTKYLLLEQEHSLRPSQLTLEQYISILNRS
ncbi:hypothetical protein K8R14_00450 [bacterium]|nr:hypothetical protein [bacterium]